MKLQTNSLLMPSSALLTLVVTMLAVSTTPAIGQVTMRFKTTKDVGIAGHENEQMFGLGDRGRLRPLKTNQNTMIMDFDTAAMQVFLDANPGSATWTLNLFPESSPISVFIGSLGIQTVESLNDWSEGDGFDGNFNWTSGTASATYFYASTVHNSGVLDSDASLEWIDPDSGPYTFTNRDPAYATYGVPTSVGGGGASTAADPTPEFTNSVDFTVPELQDAYTASTFASLAIDQNIIDAMINDPFNRGIRTGRNFAGGIVDHSNAGGNFRVWDRNQGGASNTIGPFLEVTISPTVPTDYTWSNTSGDNSFATVANWQDGLGNPKTQAPSNGDTAIFDANLFADSGGTTSNTVQVAEGTIIEQMRVISNAVVDLNIGATIAPGTMVLEGSGDGLIVGNDASDNSTLNLKAGWLVNAGSVAIGSSVGGQGEITIGEGAGLTVGDTLKVWSGGKVKFSGGEMKVNTLDLTSTNPPIAFEWTGGRLSVDSVFGGGLVNGGGTLAPETLTSIEGLYHQSTFGTLEIEISGSNLGEFDEVDITGSASLDGALEVWLLDGFIPSVGDTFEILTAADVTGTFNFENLPELSGLTWNVNYSETSVVLEILATNTADFNGDGIVDGADLSDPVLGWQTRYGADLDGSNFLDWQRQFGSGISGSLAPPETVPEPRTLASCLLAAVVFVVFRRN